MDLRNVSPIGRATGRDPVLRPSGSHYAPPSAATRVTHAIVTLLAALLSVGGLLGIAANPAAATIGAFTATDGVLDAGAFNRTDLVKNKADNSYKRGAKEEDACPAVAAGSIPPSKDDFSNFYEGLQGDVLYLAFRRSDNNGTATVDFELNQSSTECGNGVNKVRTNGDLLITYDFQGGNTVPVIQVRTFAGGSFSAPLGVAAPKSEAGISSDGLFGELAIDLRQTGIFKSGACTDFASVFPKSRASKSFSSELKDFVSPIATTISNCASITVIKDANLNGSTPFPFTFAPPAGTPTNFSLVDDGVTVNDPTPDRRTFADLTNVNGSYVITETEPTVTPGAWRLDSVVCVGGTATFDKAHHSVTVVPGGAVNVTCTFQNTFDPPPTVVVLKTARPSTVNEPGGPVTFDVVVTNTSAEAVTLTELTDTITGVTTDVFSLVATTCRDDRPLAAADSDPSGGADTYRCTFTLTVTGNARATQTDVVTATVLDGQGDTGSASDDAVVTIADVLPTISVSKTASTTSILRPGGPVTFTIVVTNLSNEGVTLTDLTDTINGVTTDVFSLGSATTCKDNATLAAADATPNGGADTYTCTFTTTVLGNANTTHENTVKATAVDDDGSKAMASDVEQVQITTVLPTLSVLKTARTTTIPEPGGPVTYDVSIQNLSTVSVTLTELTDAIGSSVVDVFAVPGTTCASGAVLAAGDGTRGGPDTYACLFTLTVTGNANSTHDDTVKATVVDNANIKASAEDVERVTLSNVAPTISVLKTASPLSVPEPGGSVTYTVVVRNLSAEAVTLTNLADTVGTSITDVFTVPGTTCRNGAVLTASDGVAGGDDTYTCTFTGTVTGNAGASHTDVVEATVVDDDASSAKASDDAVVTVTDVLPGVNVVKTASAPIVRAGDAVTYTYAVTSTTSESLTNVAVTDDKCSTVTFSSGDTNGNKLLDPSETWTFRCTSTLTASTTNVVTAAATDDEGNRTTDTDTVTVTVINPSIAVAKTADRTTAELGQTIAYTYVVTNPGDSALRNVSVSDDKCSPVAFVSGDTNGNGALDVGESWRYTCSVIVRVTGQLVNVGVVTGTPLVGPVVSGQDTATVTVTVKAPAVLGEVLEKAPPSPATAPVVEQPIVAGVVVVRPAPAPAVAPAATTRVAVAPATLPRTGSNTSTPIRGAIALLVIGGLALIPDHLRSRRNRIIRLEG